MKRLVLLLIIIALPTILHAETTNPQPPKETNSEQPMSENELAPQWDTLFKKHLTSIGIGALIGTATGTLCGYFDKKTDGNFMPLSWFMWASIRGGLKKALMHDMHLYNVPYNEKTMDFSAWISDWANYIRYCPLKTSHVQILLIAYCVSSVLGFEIG